MPVAPSVVAVPEARAEVGEAQGKGTTLAAREGGALRLRRLKVSSLGRRYGSTVALAQRPHGRRQEDTGRHRHQRGASSLGATPPGVTEPSQPQPSAVGTRRCLTPRSSRAPTACHAGPAGGTRYIFAIRARASHRWGRLNSNVRPHRKVRACRSPCQMVELPCARC